MKLKINAKGKIVNASEISKNKKAKKQQATKIPLKEIECLEKLKHTILMNYNHGNLKFGLDEFAECYETIEKALKN